MLRWAIKRKLAGEEKKLGASLDYVRHILDTSRGAFFAFARCLHLAEYRKAAPADAVAVAGIAATRDRDCGECVQIAINQAKKAGVPNSILHAAVTGDNETLPSDLKAVHELTRAVIEGDDAKANIHRDEVRGHYGERALIEIAYATAMGQFFPTIKRTLGYAESCSVRPPAV